MDRRKFLKTLGSIVAGAALIYTLGCKPVNPNKLSLELAIPSGSNTAEGIGVLMQSQLRMQGIELRLRATEINVLQNLISKKAYQLALMGMAYNGNLDDMHYLFEIDDPSTDIQEDADNFSGIDDPLMRQLFKDLKTGKDVKSLIENEFLDQQPMFFCIK